MKRFILGVCAVVAAAVLVLSVCGRKSEQPVELLADNVEALAGPEMGRAVCVYDPNSLCITVYPNGYVFVFQGYIIYL